MQWNIIHIKETESTNDYAKLNINQFEVPALIYADFQTKGRGQSNNVWYSENSKNLLCSIVLPLSLSVEYNNYISRWISIILVELLKNYQIEEEHTKIKWPNDIIVLTNEGYKKICGILIENIIEKNKITKTIIGVGLNVNQTNFQQFNKTATSIINIKRIEMPIADVINKLTLLIDNYFSLLQLQKFESINQLYTKYLYGWQNDFLFQYNNELLKGKISALLDNGKILVKTENEEYQFANKEIKFLL